MSEAAPHPSHDVHSETLPEAPIPEHVFYRIESLFPEDACAQASNLVLLTGLSARVNSAGGFASSIVPQTVLGVERIDMHISVLSRLHKAGELLYESDLEASPQVLAYDHFLKESTASHRQFQDDLSLAVLAMQRQRTGEAEAQPWAISFDTFFRDSAERHFLRSMMRHFERPEAGIIKDFEPDLLRAFWHNPEYWEAKRITREEAPNSAESPQSFTERIQAALAELPL